MREPPGAGTYGMAEVTLTFNNSQGVLPLEYDEVSISRRVYRSGEGEYFINKMPCRLRDIQELFVSCGISRAAFSIVAQGRIEEFISRRPEERRIYLEELAGIGKYRQRKADSVTKLEETEGVLVRLQDVVRELDRQLAPLAEQAKAANQYNESQERLKGLEARLVGNQFAKAAAKKQAIASGIEDLQAGKETALTRAGLMERELSDLDQGISERKERRATREQDAGQVRQQLQEAQVELVRIEEKYSSSQSRQAELNVRLQVIAQKDQEIASEMQQIANQHQRCREQKVLAEQRCLELEQTLEEGEKTRQRVNSDWEKNNGELFEVLHQKTLLASQVKEFQNQKEAVRRQQENLGQKTADNTAQDRPDQGTGRRKKPVAEDNDCRSGRERCGIGTGTAESGRDQQGSGADRAGDPEAGSGERALQDPPADDPGIGKKQGRLPEGSKRDPPGQGQGRGLLQRDPRYGRGTVHDLPGV